jgi:polysaccharide deacetylase family protein (PEP-CTERM system associated)
LITVDVEDWFQVENLRSLYPQASWDSCSQRVRLGTSILLDLFEHYGVRATFFVLGWTAERQPELIREIRDRGHEIASHGYNHRLCSELSEPELREDLSRSKAILEEITGLAVVGYRAPAFSIGDHVMNLLGETGYKYDSSWNRAAVSQRYGKLRQTHQDPSKGYFMSEDGVMELPISNLRLKNVTIPWGGGGYFRLWPPSLFRWGVSRIISDEGFYLFYFHPWELDSAQPRVREVGIFKRFRHYLNLPVTFHRLSAFLSAFQGYRFEGCQTYLDGYDRNHNCLG